MAPIGPDERAGSHTLPDRIEDFVHNVTQAAAAIAAAGLLTLAGCGGGSEGESSTLSDSSSSQVGSDSERAYLADLHAEGLLGDYEDDELLVLGHTFCDMRDKGEDPYADGRSTGDGAFEFEALGVTVLASDTIEIDFAAREHFCPDAPFP